MSQENVDIVREAIRLMNESEGGEPAPRLFELVAPDVRIDMSRRVLNPDVYEGHAGMARLGAEVSDVWDEFRIHPERFVDAGDRVIVIETRRGRGKGSGVEVETRAASVWTLRHGRIAAMKTDVDPAEALASASA